MRKLSKDSKTDLQDLLRALHAALVKDDRSKRREYEFDFRNPEAYGRRQVEAKIREAREEYNKRS